MAAMIAVPLSPPTPLRREALTRFTKLAALTVAMTFLLLVVAVSARASRPPPCCPHWRCCRAPGHGHGPAGPPDLPGPAIEPARRFAPLPERRRSRAGARGRGGLRPDAAGLARDRDRHRAGIPGLAAHGRLGLPRAHRRGRT